MISNVNLFARQYFKFIFVILFPRVFDRLKLYFVTIHITHSSGVKSHR